MEEKKNKIFKGQLPVSVIYILLGLCLALMPVETVNVLCKVVFGLVLIAAGLYHIFLFAFEKENGTILDLFSGVIVLVIGAFLFMNPPVVIKLLTLMLGAFILVDSIWMLRGSLKLKKKKLGIWKAFLIESLIFVVLGILILMNPFSELKMTMEVSGWIFVANGVLDIIFYIILQHGMKKEVVENTDDGNAVEKEKNGDSENTSGNEKDADNENISENEKVTGSENTSENEKNTDNENTFVNEKNADSENGWDTRKDADSEEGSAGENSVETETEEVLEEWKD